MDQNGAMNERKQKNKNLIIKWREGRKKKRQLIKSDYSLKDSFELKDLVSLLLHFNIFAFSVDSIVVLYSVENIDL